MSDLQRYDVVWRDEDYQRVKDVDGRYALWKEANKRINFLREANLDLNNAILEKNAKIKRLEKELKKLRDGFAQSIEARSKGL